ncbi:VOC family protein [Nocardia fusca]|uniref:VOC family protein n=1 Tax=Nocardia fusca TaxID=941183 RepID=UPI0037CAA86B
MVSKPRLAHVVLQTSRPDELRDWYCKVLQAHVVYEGHGLCFITCDEEHHRLALMGAAELQPRNPGASGMHHTAYTFDDLDALLTRYSELERQGITPRVPIQHGVTTSLYYQDPDGNFIELQADNFATPDEATEYMHGPEYASNPVGVAFDPATMIEARESGTPVSELTTQSWARTACPGLPDPLAILTGA